MSQPPSSAPPWPEQWAVQASVDAERICNRLDAVTARRLTPAEAASKAAVTKHLEQARDACRCTRKLRRRGWRDRWRGSSIERAFLHLHAAKIFLIDLLPPAELEAVVPDVTTRLAMALDRNDPRRVEAETQLRTVQGPARRAVLKQAMEVAYDASDEQYVRLRDFRNIILLTALAMAVLTGLLVFFVAIFPDAIPLCFKPGVTTAATNTQAAQQLFSVCPSGDLPQQQPEAGDILIVAGLGAIGGALGALVAIRNLRGTSTPYSVATALAILKGPSGALTAIIGMLLLAGGFVPGLTNLDSQRQILAYALVFGIAQQLVTRVADDRAQQLLNQLPSKDPQGQSAQVLPMTRPAPAPTPLQDASASTPPPDTAAGGDDTGPTVLLPDTSRSGDDTGVTILLPDTSGNGGNAQPTPAEAPALDGERQTVQLAGNSRPMGN
ncbi:hypothetical protein ODJ79_24430 [Actinoplanes sp. KI2]|uniref:hypothetical protein n=1 Tax=Actinoplanes sp. KI2 TaxID=2983315 RepID=UPI0021D58B18|nr:hypothetical protein [Actinoplanes sp. KI2]MCU7726885.1 hypothetical protein [Actinoplanes sp. KI2]